MKISVVIPLYNKRNHVARAIDSVLGQTVRPHEIIVVDDGSTDGSAEELIRYGNGVTLITQKNGGESVARNTGIARATGEFVAFLDADDSWKPWFLEKISALIQRFPDAGMYALSYEFVSDGSARAANLYGIPRSSWSGEIEYFKVAAFGEPPVTSSTAVVRRTIFDRIGGFPVGKRMGPDGDMWGRIALAYPVAIDATVGATYFLNATNRVCARFEKTDDHPFIETCRRVKLSDFDVTLREQIRWYLLRLKLNDARMCVINREFAKAKIICKGEPFRPFLLRRLAWTTHLNVLTYLLFMAKK